MRNIPLLRPLASPTLPKLHPVPGLPFSDHLHLQRRLAPVRRLLKEPQAWTTVLVSIVYTVLVSIYFQNDARTIFFGALPILVLFAQCFDCLPRLHHKYLLPMIYLLNVLQQGFFLVVFTLGILPEVRASDVWVIPMSELIQGASDLSVNLSALLVELNLALTLFLARDLFFILTHWGQPFALRLRKPLLMDDLEDSHIDARFCGGDKKE